MSIDTHNSLRSDPEYFPVDLIHTPTLLTDSVGYLKLSPLFKMEMSHFLGIKLQALSIERFDSESAVREKRFTGLLLGLAEPHEESGPEPYLMPSSGRIPHLAFEIIGQDDARLLRIERPQGELYY